MVFIFDEDHEHRAQAKTYWEQIRNRSTDQGNHKSIRPSISEACPYAEHNKNVPNDADLMFVA